MKKAKLSALLVSAAFIAAGCSGMMGGKSDTKSDSSSQSSSSRSAGTVVDDATITSKVKTALLADPEISGLKINVDTSKGRVTLKGEVKSLALRKKAESLVRDVEGVKSVDNQLIITG